MWRAFGLSQHAASGGVQLLSSALESRVRLEACLRHALDGRLTILSAAPGYGKSSALVRMARLDRRPAVWHWCNPYDDGASLVRLVASAVAGPFSLDSAETREDWGAALREVLASVPQPRLILLDDVDRLQPHDLDRLLSFVASEMPDGWHVGLTSTRELNHPRLERLLRSGDASRLDEVDLALDADEATIALTARGLSHLQAVQHLPRVLGWPLGIQAISAGDDEALLEYFRGLLERQPPAIRRFVESTSVLESLTPAGCRAVTGQTSVTSALDQVVASHLFVLRTSEGLMYHPLFRDAVLRLLREQRPRWLARACARAADYYLVRGDDQRAIRVALGSRDGTQAIELLRRAAPRAIASGRGAELLDWLASFPPAVLHDPWLLHYRGVGVRMTTEDHAAAWRLQEQARAVFEAAGDRQGRVLAIAELGMLACLRKRPADAERLLEEARAELSGADSYLHVSILCALADAYVALNRFREAELAGEEALARAGDVPATLSPNMQVQALYRLLTVHFREGTFANALDDAARALNLARDHPHDVETGILAAYLDGLANAGKGELDRALEVLGAAATRAATHGLAQLRRSIQTSMAEVLAHHGRLDESDALFASIGNPSSVYGDVGVLRLLQGRLVEARTMFRQQLEDASRAGRLGDVGRAKAALGVIAIGMGHHVEAEHWLLDAARGFEQTGARFRLAGAHLHLAHLYLLLNDPVRCRRSLRLALDFAVEAGSYTFFLWHPATVATVAAQALAEGLHHEYVERLCHVRLGAADVRPFLTLLASHDPDVRDSATRIVRGIFERAGKPLTLAELHDCRDATIRARLASALAEGRLTSHGLLLLRHRHRLTWAELDVFVAYYLDDPQTHVDGDDPERRTMARRLHVSENTLMHHITSIRHKLGLGARRGSAVVFLWALLAHITRVPDVPADRSDARLVGSRASVD
jgi:tetratricopeptide (TPR) repeat protein